MKSIDRPSNGAFLGGGVLVALALFAALTLGGAPAQAAFPGLNGRISCSGAIADPPSSVSGSRLELFAINPDGTDERRLTTNENSDFGPKYSADGRKIVFVKDNQVWTINADGTDEFGPLTGPDAVPPAVATGGTSTFVGGWSPDGNQIVFLSSRDGNPEVYKMNADGSNPVNLTNNALVGGSNDSQPAWAPDGRTIAFQSNRLGNPNIHLMSSDGGPPIALTSDSPAEESAPEFSPDGTKIAFHSDRDAPQRTNATGRNLEIYRMSSDDGSNVTRLTFNDFSGGGPDAAPSLDLTGFDLFPHWSPDGRRIVFHSGRAPEFRDTGQAGIVAQWEAYHIDAVNGENAPGGLVRLTNRPGNDERCTWQALAPPLPGPGPGPGGPAPPPPTDETIRPNLIRPGVARAVQVGSKVVVRLRGKMIDNEGRSCEGRLKIGTRAGVRRVATRIGRMGANCRYAKKYSFPVRALPPRLRPRSKTLVLTVAIRFQGNLVLKPDLSPPKRIKVRR